MDSYDNDEDEEDDYDDEILKSDERLANPDEEEVEALIESDSD